MTPDLSASNKVFAGIVRASARNAEFTAKQVLAHAPGDPPSEGTLYGVLNAQEEVGVLRRQNRGNQTYWSLVEDPKVPVEERIIERGGD